MKLLFKVKKPVDVVFDYLTDMQKFTAVHPVINRIENINGNTYKVFETYKFGIIPYSFTYKAVVESNTETKTVTISATVNRINKIKMVFDITPENDYTIIEENISIKSPLPIKSFMQKVFREQHQLLFNNIESA